MNPKTKLIIGAVAVVGVLLGAILLFGGDDSSSPTSAPSKSKALGGGIENRIIEFTKGLVNIDQKTGIEKCTINTLFDGLVSCFIPNNSNQDRYVDLAAATLVGTSSAAYDYAVASSSIDIYSGTTTGQALLSGDFRAPWASLIDAYRIATNTDVTAGLTGTTTSSRTSSKSEYDQIVQWKQGEDIFFTYQLPNNITSNAYERSCEASGQCPFASSSDIGFKLEGRVKWFSDK